MTTTAIVVGNPKPRSRTFEAAGIVAEALLGSAPDLAFDLADFGAGLLDWSDASVGAAIDTLAATDFVVFASPTFKGTYTGLLKLFLDRIGAGALRGVTGVPLMLGGDWRHSLAPDVLLKPVLVEIGVTCPTRGLFLTEADYASPAALDGWLDLARAQVAATMGQLR